MAEVLMKMRPGMSNCPGMEPRMRFRQRHFRPQLGVKGRAAFHDAYLDVDLRTLGGDPDEGVKAQPEWMDAAFRVLTNKNLSLELQIGAVFPTHAALRYANQMHSIMWQRPGSGAGRSSRGSEFSSPEGHTSERAPACLSI